MYPTHPSVLAYKPHKTVQAVEAKKDKAEERERKEKEAEEKKKSEVHVQELWKPHGQTLGLFVAAEQEYVPPLSSSAVLVLTRWAGQHVDPVHPRLDQGGLHGLRRGT